MYSSPPYSCIKISGPYACSYLKYCTLLLEDGETSNGSVTIQFTRNGYLDPVHVAIYKGSTIVAYGVGGQFQQIKIYRYNTTIRVGSVNVYGEAFPYYPPWTYTQVLYVTLLTHDDDSSSSSSSSSSSIDSSSSSSSSSNSSEPGTTSSYSSSSSSSSSSDFNIRDIRAAIIDQNNHNLLPFSILTEPGFGMNAELQFNIDASNNSSLNVGGIIGRLISPQMNAGGSDLVYVPQDSDAYYQHNPSFHVDVIGKSIAGIKDAKVMVGQGVDSFESVTASFSVPKFTWDNSIYGHSIITLPSTLSNFWAGSSVGDVSRMQFSSNVILKTHDITTGSYVNSVSFGKNDNKVYITTDNDVISYAFDKLIGGYNLSFITKVPNLNRNSFILDDDNLWTTQTYYGRIARLNKDTLAEVASYSGLDGPFKILKSNYHNMLIFIGAHNIWKLQGDTMVSLYSVSDYKIVDADISEDGSLCLLLSSVNGGYIRILDNDFYSFILNEKIDMELRFCKYCNQKFYILAEDNASLIGNYVFYMDTKYLALTFSEKIMQPVTTTTTTQLFTDVIKITNPNALSALEVGTEYEIKWISSKAVNDEILIELYKGDVFYETIASSAPNTGVYKWIIPAGFENGINYAIKLTWISSAVSDLNTDISDNFVIADNVVTTTTTTTIEMVTNRVAGILYDSLESQIVVILQDGSYGLFSLVNEMYTATLDGTTAAMALPLKPYWFFRSGLTDITAVEMREEDLETPITQMAIRVFVGSKPNISDKWDSGTIYTALRGIYYGGGNNLTPGYKYYVNIQVSSLEYGWSEVQTREFVIPR